MVGARVLEEVVNVDRYIRKKITDHLPRTSGVLDHTETELTGSRTVKVPNIQVLTSAVVGSSLSGRGE